MAHPFSGLARPFVQPHQIKKLRFAAQLAMRLDAFLRYASALDGGSKPSLGLQRVKPLRVALAAGVQCVGRVHLLVLQRKRVNFRRLRRWT